MPLSDLPAGDISAPPPETGRVDDDALASRIRRREDEPPEGYRPSMPQPLLASEALIEDLAPLEPARRAARIWCAVVGAAFAGFAALSFLGMRPGGVEAALPSSVLAGLALLASLGSISYRHR